MGFRIKPQTVGFGSSRQAERCINTIFRALKCFVLPNYSAQLNNVTINTTNVLSYNMC